MRDLDIILRGADCIDGSGAPRYRADIGIAGDRIAVIAPCIDARARQDIDVSGKVITPGFIDVHTHDDRALIETPRMLPKLTQGVTTVVSGNCGISLAPLVMDAVVPPLDIIAEPASLKYPDFASFLEAICISQPAVNVIALVGHTTLRVHVMHDLARAATPAECDRMRALVEEAMRAGAWGFSTGTFYPPARAASTQEIIAVGEPVGRHGGVYATHMRNEAEHVLQSLDETFDIGRALGVRVVISHHKLAGVAHHGKSVQTLARIEAAMRAQPVSLDCYPYDASSTMLHPDLIARASRVLVAWSSPFPQHAGKLLCDIAAEMQCTQEDAARCLMPAGAIYFLMDEADVRRILAFKPTMIGSDGLPHDAHPHPRLWGTFPRVLGHYSRDEGLFSLEEAVRKMSGQPAADFGLEHRGLVREGYFADLVVIDAARIQDRASFAHPSVPAQGVCHVFVNGQHALADGSPTDWRGGRVLRGPGYSRARAG